MQTKPEMQTIPKLRDRAMRDSHELRTVLEHDKARQQDEARKRPVKAKEEAKDG